MTTVASSSTSAPVSRPAALGAAPSRACPVRWISSARFDLTLAALWVPFAVLGWAATGHGDALPDLLAATLTFSALHQPLTLVLVYGDRRVLRSRRAVFLVSPALLLGLVVLGMEVSFVLLALVAGVWNAVHTLRQRYGITRIYGRRGGDGHGSLERALLYSWLGLVVVAAAADPRTAEELTASGLGGSNRRAIELLVSTAPVAKLLLPLLALAAAVATARWLAHELRHPTPNPAKWIYLASTAALFVVMVIDPLVGLIAYVGAHAAEYFMIVYTQLPRRHPDAAADGGALVGHVVRSRVGRTGFLAGYGVLAVGLVAGTAALGYPWSAIFLLTAGGLHLFYDGLIWKLRRDDVARGFGLARSGPTASGPLRS